MFREMRRVNQQMSDAEAQAILTNGTSGVLAVSGDDGYPYAVPLSYAYLNGKLYFHCALTGHKLDAIRRCDKASFCVIDADDVQPKAFTTHYKSVIVFGRARIIEDENEKRAAAMLIGEKYSHGYDVEGKVEDALSRMGIVEMDIEHVTGKKAKELM